VGERRGPGRQRREKRWVRLLFSTTGKRREKPLQKKVLEEREKRFVASHKNGKQKAKKNSFV